MEGLKEKVVRGGAAKLCGQAANFILRIGFTAIMARLLAPEDFGLVAMVLAVTCVYSLFTTAGLSLATVQTTEITGDQVSNLFWVNLLVGAALGLVCVATAPMLVSFYNEPRLFWVTVAIGAGFLLNAAGVQHSALLQREMRYVDLTIIEAASLVVSYALGITLALLGFAHWALVASTVATPAISSALMWKFAEWVPGPPRRHADIRTMLNFGGTVTLNNLVIYVGYNFDKILIGRIWGPAALGIYGTAYQLVNVPTSNLTAAVGGIAFSALSRLQQEPERFKTYFLNGLFLVVSATAPITIFSALFADDVVAVILGEKWAEAATIFRLLTPTILVFSMINPTGWLLQSTGLQVRSLRIGLVIAPLAIIGYLAGMPYGPKGIAFGFSAAMTLWVVPHVLWSLHGTTITPSEFFNTTLRPFIASVIAAMIAFAAAQLWLVHLEPLSRLAMVGPLMLASYFCILVFVAGERGIYLRHIKGIKPSFHFPAAK